MLPEPRAAGDRRAVRHAGRAAPRPHRPRARPRAGHRSGHDARAAARPARRRAVPAGRARAAGLPRGRDPRSPASTRCPAAAPTCRSTSSARRCSAPSSPPRSGLPYAFASHFAPARCSDAVARLPERVPAVRAARPAVRHRRRQRASPPTPRTRPREQLRGRAARTRCAACSAARATDSATTRSRRILRVPAGAPRRADADLHRASARPTRSPRTSTSSAPARRRRRADRRPPGRHVAGRLRSLELLAETVGLVTA